MKIIVTGGTGFVGRRLVERLDLARHEVTTLTRDVARAVRHLPARCRPRAWNPTGPVDCGLLRGADAVIHLAGEGVADGWWTAKRKDAIRRSRVESTRALVRAVTDLPAQERPRTFISASAIGFYGDRGDVEVEESAEAGAGFLADVCQAWEREAFRAEDVGVRTVVVRIGVVLGRQGGALGRMLLPFRLGLGGYLGSGQQWMSWVHLEDLVSLFTFLLERAESRGPVNGVAPNPVTNRGFTAELAAALSRPAILPIPAPVLRALLGEMSSVFLASQRVAPHVAAELGFAWRFPTLAAALADVCADPSREVIREQWVARPPAEVFPFFSDPRNLEQITPPFLRFRVLGMSTPTICQGTLIDYRLALRGLPLRWQSRIETWQPDRSFVDVQVRGPYSLWHHTHEFEPADGGTIIRDRVRYAVPFGALGELLAGWLVARDVTAIFDYRREQIQAALG